VVRGRISKLGVVKGVMLVWGHAAKPNRLAEENVAT
jgi:hypothetical protein